MKNGELKRKEENMRKNSLERFENPAEEEEEEEGSVRSKSFWMIAFTLPSALLRFV